MKIEEVMSATPRTCRPDDDLARAASELWEGDVGFLPVVDDDGCVLAVVSDRDICMCAFTRGKSLGELSVKDCMSESVHTCMPHQDTDHALELVAANNGKDSDRFYPWLARAQALMDLGRTDEARAALDLAAGAGVDYGQDELQALRDRADAAG